jgi:hypothetical protein
MPRRFIAISRGDESDIDGDPIAIQLGYRRNDVVYARRDRDGHSHDVVHHQGARHDEPGGATEVAGRHLVGATAAGVGAHHLPVGQHHDRQQDDDSETDPRRQVQERQPAEAEYQ